MFRRHKMSPYKPKRQRRFRLPRPVQYGEEGWFDAYASGNPWYEGARVFREIWDETGPYRDAAKRLWQEAGMTSAPSRPMTRKGPPPGTMTRAPMAQGVTTSSWSDFTQVGDQRGKLDIVGDVTIWDTNNGVVESTDGNQAIKVINQGPGSSRYCNFDSEDLDDMWTRLVVAYPELSETDHVNAYSETLWLYVRDMWTTTDFCNMSNQTCVLTICDAVKASSNRLQGSPSDPAFRYGPEETWSYGVQEQTVPAGTFSIEPRFIGARPQDSKRFTHEWQIRSSTIVTLGPGQSHRHYTHWAPNRLIRRSEWRRYGSTDSFEKINDYIRSLSHSTFIYVHGQVCCAQSAGVATYSDSKICYVQTRRFNCQMAIGEYVVQHADLTQNADMGTNVMNERTANAEPYEEAG